MICRRCGEETSNVICSNCGVNVVWYNKYGYKIFENDSKEDKCFDLLPDSIYDIEEKLKEIFVPDGSGD